MKILLKLLVMSILSFIIMLGVIYGLVYEFRDKGFPLQKKIVNIFQKDTAMVVDSSLITGIPTAEQLRARDYEKRELDLEREKLKLTEEQQRINNERDSLEAVKRELGMLTGQREGYEKERIQKLAKVCEGMRPEDAAPIISQLDDQTIVEIFLQMDDRRVARILGEMPIDRATEITQRLSGAVMY